jgi:hypothetical protein
VLITGKWTPESLDDMLRHASTYNSPGERIFFISSFFLGLAYKEFTLIGSALVPEVFVINLREVDCFTLIDYIEAMRLSASFGEFEMNLRKIRYRSGKIEFTSRNHFFTDWSKFNTDFVDDITEHAGGGKTKRINKELNIGTDGTFLINGIRPFKRELSYIPSDVIDDMVISNLRTGDYIGFYSDKPGLDVSHTGIFVRVDGEPYLRHASSAMEYRKVVDQNFKNYAAGKPGIMVLRPK